MTTSATTTLTSPDGDLAVLHHLGGDGPPLLLTHGNGLNAGMWATVVPHLAERFRCFGLDFRGHGRSRPDGEMSVARSRFVDDAMAAVAELGGGPLVGAGHSLGGATLLKAELRAAGTFRRLWVYEPVMFPADWERPSFDEHPMVQGALRRRADFDSVDDAVHRFMAKPPFSACEADAVRAYVEIGTVARPDGGVTLSCTPEREASIYGGDAAMDFADLASVACPVVVAGGAGVPGGTDLPNTLAPLVADALGDGSWLPFDGLTHFGPMEDGAAIAEAIASHLAD